MNCKVKIHELIEGHSTCEILFVGLCYMLSCPFSGWLYTMLGVAWGY